jgi:Cu+-exporting ATPase
MSIDPVCGMEIEEVNAKERVTHQGRTYFFCSVDCREEFEADPEEYVGEERTGT